MNEAEMLVGSPTLGQYGKSFQEKVVQALLVDRAWAEQMTEVFNTSYLDVKYLSFLSDRYFGHAKKYKVFPTLQLLVTIIRDELKVGTDSILREQIVDYLTRMRANPDPGDLQYVKDKSLDFCRKQALKQALTAAVDKMQANKYEEIVDSIKKAVIVGTTPALGHDLFKDYEARFTPLQRNPIATGFDEFDRKEIFQGGLGTGELGVVCANPGVGKSHTLICFGANALRNGVDVLHYTMELSETVIGIRYDSNLCDIDSNEVVDNKKKVLENYEVQHGKWGRLIIKHFPVGAATVFTLRAHIERLSAKGFKPGLIIVDYADNMRSTRQSDALRHELKFVYEELRGYADELGVPLWTASQSNKEGSSTEIVDLGNMSEAYGKAMVADVVFGLSRRSYEKAKGGGRLYLAKNRLGRDGLVYPILINTARSKIVVSGQAEGLEDPSKENEAEFKKALKTRWREIKNDPTFDTEATKPASESVV